VKKDCILSEWSQWSDCTQGTDEGQKYRARQITQKPQRGGKDCQELVLSETIGCDVHGPEICELGDWKEWNACSVSCGMGWHVRAREIAQPARRGGLPCSGDLKELDHCEDVSCHGTGAIDCKLSPWGAWSMCGVDNQRYRDRKIAQPAANQGEACEGGMHETETCALDKVDCSCSDWTAWDACDVPCGRGQQHRQRQISRFPQNGGETCPHDLMQTQGCDGPQGPCKVEDCKLSNWDDWSECSMKCGPGTKTRNRAILQIRDFSGQGCSGALGQTEQCEDNAVCEQTDCTWSQWTDWDACDKSCGGGQKRRSRQIDEFPTGGGKKCEAKTLKELDACNANACGHDVACEDGAWGNWEDWTVCSASCDGGTKFRTRNIVKEANQCGCTPDGKDREVSFCNTDVHCGGSADCELSEWTHWVECSASCNGITRRNRNVAKYGKGNGKFCSGSLQEVNPCNPSRGEKLPAGCLSGPPADCELSPWAPWSICGKTCDGDQQLRTRRIQTHPTNGGKPCNDGLTEIKECARQPCEGEPPVDCAVGEWLEWAACDRCNGERKRRREHITAPRNGGMECDPTAMEEIGKCDRVCHEERVCEWDDWEKWTDCTVSCGTGGQKKRQRKLHQRSVADTMTSYEVSSARISNLDSRILPDLLFAFTAGCIAVLAAVGGFRVLSRVSYIQRWHDGATGDRARLALLRRDPENGTYHHLNDADSEIRLEAETTELE